MTAADLERDPDHLAFDVALRDASSVIGLPLDEAHRSRMWAHFHLVVEANRQFNLTRITTPAEAAVLHYADSLSLLAAPWIDRERPLSVLDVGTGAGFPAVPLAMVCGHWQITAIDGTGKKTRFVAGCADSLGLRNLHVQHARGADLARSGGARFDLVLMRAVTQLAPGLKEVHTLLRPAGIAVFYKAASIGEDELCSGREEARGRELSELPACEIALPSAGGLIARRLFAFQRPDRSDSGD